MREVLFLHGDWNTNSVFLVKSDQIKKQLRLWSPLKNLFIQDCIKRSASEICVHA